jgi:hypothetical protein
MVSAVAPAAPSEIENEVISLFDELEGRLSAYVLSFGLTTHDAEDIVQETFFPSSGICSLAVRGEIFAAGFSALVTISP